MGIPLFRHLYRGFPTSNILASGVSLNSGTSFYSRYATSNPLASSVWISYNCDIFPEDIIPFFLATLRWVSNTCGNLTMYSYMLYIYIIPLWHFYNSYQFLLHQHLWTVDFLRFLIPIRRCLFVKECPPKDSFIKETSGSAFSWHTNAYTVHSKCRSLSATVIATQKVLHFYLIHTAA